jgi:hypothetical protein
MGIPTYFEGRMLHRTNSDVRSLTYVKHATRSGKRQVLPEFTPTGCLLSGHAQALVV